MRYIQNDKIGKIEIVDSFIDINKTFKLIMKNKSIYFLYMFTNNEWNMIYFQRKNLLFIEHIVYFVQIVYSCLLKHFVYDKLPELIKVF